MKAATISELKQELNVVSRTKLLELCVRLAKYKKDNKELLSYLLFEAHDEASFIKTVKEEMDLQFAAINKSNLYFAKKSLRKILRITNKYIRYTGSGQVEIELLIHYCKAMISSGIPIQKNIALTNIYLSQQKKITKVIATLHEDLQYDYLLALKELI